MSNQPIPNERFLHEGAVTDKFLDAPSDDSFADLFTMFTPQLVAFFRARNCGRELAEDLAQDVMLTVHRKAWQVRDRALFRGWLFKIAKNALCRYYSNQTRAVDTVNLEAAGERLAANHEPAGTPAFEFFHWMAFLDTTAQATPIGTVQWRVFNAKKKLAPHLTARQAA
jgi:DNA-directed RNA polymerase specialized sigma24 family protein